MYIYILYVDKKKKLQGSGISFRGWDGDGENRETNPGRCIPPGPYVRAPSSSTNRFHHQFEKEFCRLLIIIQKYCASYYDQDAAGHIPAEAAERPQSKQ